MNKRVVFCALFGAAVLCLSCNKDSLKQEPIAIDARGLTSLDEVEIPLLGGEVTVAFTADEDWAVGTKPAWLDIDGILSMSGKAGTSTLTLRAEANVSGDDRDIDIPFISKESKDTLAVLAIRQESVRFIVQQYASLTDTMRFSWHDYQVKEDGVVQEEQPGSEPISIFSNIKWRITTDDPEQAKFIFSQLSGEGKNAREEQTIQVVPASPNFELDTVTVKATFIPLMPDGKTPVEGIDGVQLVLEQGNLRFLSSWNPENTIFTIPGDPSSPALFSELGPVSGNAPYQFTVDSEEPWIVQDYPEWLQLKLGDEVIEAGKEISPGIFTVAVSAVSANPMQQERSFTIHTSPVVPGYENLESAVRELHLQQSPFVFELQDEDGRPVSGQDFGFDFQNDDRFDDADTEVYTVYLRTSASMASLPFEQTMEMEGLPDWMKYQARRDGDRYKLDFSLAKQNLAFSKVEIPSVAPVVLQTKRELFDAEPENMSRHFLFSQAPFVFTVNWPAQLENIGCRNTKTYDVQVQSSGDWYIEVDYQGSSSEWFKEEQGQKEGGKGATHLLIGAAGPNPNTDRPRSAVVRFISKNHDGRMEEDRNMVQTEYQFKVFRHAEDLSAGRPELTAFDNDFQAYVPTELQSNPQSLDERKVYVYLKCDGPWELSKWPDFLEPRQTYSNDEEGFMDYIQFRIKTGESSRREGEIVIRADNGTEKTISVAQEAFVFELQRNMTELPPYSADNLSIGTMNLSPDVKWKIVRDGRDVTTEAVSQRGTTDLLIPLAVNYDKDRIQNIRYSVEVTEPSGIQAKNLDFSQAGFTFGISEDRMSFTEVQEVSQDVQVECSGPWHIQEDLSGGWLHTSPASFNGSSPMNVYVDKNLNTLTRSGHFTLVSDAHAAGGRTWEIPVRVDQSNYKWSVTAADGSNLNYHLDPATLWEKELKIVSSSAWSVDLPSWLTMEPSSGQGDESGKPVSVTLSSTKNLSVKDSRSETLLIKSEYADENGELQQDIKIEQAPFIWEVTSDAWTGNSGARKMTWDSPVDVNAKTFKVHSSGKWQIQSGSQVISESGKSLGNWKFTWGAPAQDGFVTVRATPVVNNSREKQILAAAIVSVDHLEAKIDLKESLTLEQAAYVLNIGNENPEEPVLREVAPWNTENESQPQILTLPVASSAGWKLEKADNVSWLTLENQRDASIDVRIQNYNVTEKAREARLVLKSTQKDITLEQEIVLTQQPFVFKTADPSQTTLPFHADGGTVDIPIECSASWSVGDISKRDMVTSAYRDGDKLHLVVASYTQSAPRVGTVKLESHGVELTITVTQGSYKFDITGLDVDNEHVFAPVQNKSLSFTLVSNVAWSIEYPEWLTLRSGREGDNPNNSEKTYQFTFVTKAGNQTANANSGEIVLRNDLEEKRFRVRQDGFQTGTITLEDFAEYAASDQTTLFNASIGWSVEVSDNWLHVTPVSGEGATTFTVSVEDNTGAERQGYFQIKDVSGYNLSRTVNVKQKGFKFTVSASEHQFPVIVTNNDRWSFDVDSSSPCNITVKDGSDASWFSFSPEGIPAGKKTTVTVTPRTNDTEEPRTAVLVVTPVLSGIDAKEITMSQDPFVFNVTGPEPFAFNPVEASTQTIKIECTKDCGWTVSKPSWLIWTSNHEGAGNGSVTLKADSNTGNSQRTGDVTVSNNVNNKVFTFRAIQDAFDKNKVTLQAFADLNAKAQTFQVVATGDWAIASKPDWIEVTPDHGTGSQNVSVRAQDNTSSARSDFFKVTYTATGGYALEKKVNVSQKEFNFNTDEVQLEFDALKPASKTFQVSCSGGWTLSGTPEWLTVSSSEGSGSTTITVKPSSQNLDTSPRYATLMVTSSLNEAYRKRIRVTQNAYDWNGVPVTIEVDATQQEKQLFITSSGKWHISNELNWVVVAPSSSSGSGNAEVTITITRNMGTAREGTFTVVNDDIVGLSRQVTIRQAGVSTPDPSPAVAEAVDLGLPSGLKWASFNVGATKPEEYGEYFAWGETEPKNEYVWSLYKYGGETKLTKYCTESSYWNSSDPMDNKTVLDLADDAAHVNWGGSWRMPTGSNWQELMDECNWAWITDYNGTGVAGWKVNNKQFGYEDKFIFLPCAGYQLGTSQYSVGSIGRYWSSSLDTDTPNRAYYIFFNSENYSWNLYTRYCGLSVRPVSE